ncbi:MAG: hypothetical protein JST83_16435 [Bacteroidetes bacterium]|nr:hypothetical protein [Bacteroidota bacterium]
MAHVDARGCFDTVLQAGLYWFEPAILVYNGSDTITLRPDAIATITLHIKPMRLNPYDIYSRRRLTTEEVQSLSDSICCACSHSLIRDHTCYVMMEI